MSSEDYKARVKKQLQHYAPEKAAQADALLSKYVGKEDKLLAALVKQYGPEKSGGGAAAAAAGGGDYKARVKAQLQKYAPEKAAQADALLAKYVGKEDKLLEALVKQYGPEGSGGGGGTAATPKTQSPAPTTSAAAGAGGDYKTRVKAQLQKYAPEKAAQADALLSKYVGKEDKLLEALVKQYGPEPNAGGAGSSTAAATSPSSPAASPSKQSPAPTTSASSGGGDYKSRVRAQLQKYAPEKAAQADALLAKYVGKEDKLLEALVKQYGPEPSLSSSSAAAQKPAAQPQTSSPSSQPAQSGGGDYKTRVKAQLQKYAPEKAAQADALLAKYVGKEDKLLEALVKQYGPEPTTAGSSSSPQSSPSSPAAQPKQTTPPTQQAASPPSSPSASGGGGGGGDYKSRIKAQLQKYAPEKAAQADALLAKYAGKEDKLLEALVKQYGPEPTAGGGAGFSSPTALPAQQQQTPSSPVSGGAGGGGGGDIKSRVKAQLQKYAPEKSAQSDALLAKYAGKEEKLLEALVKQYGPEPTTSAGSGAQQQQQQPASPVSPPPPAGNATEPPSSPNDLRQQQSSPSSPTSFGQQQQQQQNPNDYKSRVKAQLQKYAPEKAAQSDALLAKYAGKEDKLLEALVKQYGPEPTSFSSPTSAPSSPTTMAMNQQQAPSSPVSGAAGGDIKTRIKAHLQHYAPEKAAQSDALLTKYAGKEEKLLDALVKQYGPEPGGQQQQQQQSSPSSPAQQQAATSQSQSAFPTATSSQQQPKGDVKSRIKAVLQKYAPEKVGQSDALISKYAGKEDKLLDALVKQYGPEPEAVATVTAPPAQQQFPSASNYEVDQQQKPQQYQSTSQYLEKDFPTRIKDLLQHYVPEKASQANTIISKYSGKEELLLEQLVKQYGPEPGSPEFVQKQQQQQQSSSVDMMTASSSNNNLDRSRSASPPSKPSDSMNVSQRDEYTRRVKNMIGLYAPEKISNVDVLLEKYQGKEQQLIDVLVNQYGPEPGTGNNNNNNASPQRPQQLNDISTVSPSGSPSLQPASPSSASPTMMGQPSNSIPDRIRRLVAKYDPKKEEQVPQLLEKFKGKEQNLLDALVKQYGPEPSFDYSSSASAGPQTIESLPKSERIRRLVKHYAPDRDEAQINSLLAKAAGQEERLLQSLVKQYGPEPPITMDFSSSSPPGSPTSASASVSPHQQQIRDQIIRLLQEKDPSRTARLPALFTRYLGEEQRLLGMLQLRYSSGEQADRDLIPFPSAEPPSQSAAPSASDAQRAVKAAEQKALLRKDLSEIFAKSAPHKLPEVDKMTEAFFDEPERILSVMKDRYLNIDGTPKVDVPPSSTTGQQRSSSTGGKDGSPSSSSSKPFNAADAKRVIYLRLENLFRTYCPQKLHETSSVLDAWEHAAGYPSSMFKALYAELRVPPEDQTFHSGLEAVLSGGHIDPSAILSRRGARRNTILGQAGRHGDESASARRGGAHSADAEGVGLAPPASPGTITSKGKLLLRFVAGRSILHRDQDGSLRKSDEDPSVASMKSPANIWCGVMYPAGHDVYRSPKMTVDIEGNGEWEEDRTNLCALLVTPGESPLLTLSVYNDAGFFLGELRLNLQRLPHKSQHSFTLRPRVEEHDGLILSTAQRNNGTGLGELEVKWSFNQDRTGASGAGIGNSLGITQDGNVVGNTKESLDQMQQQLSSVKAPVNPIRPRIRAFFARYIPEHLHEVPAVLEEYRGRETELLDALCVRFGPEPDPMSFQTRIERIFCDYDAGRVPEARQIAQKSVGKEEFVIRTLVKKYGSEPAPNYSLPPVGGTAPHPPSDPSRIRLTRWLMLRLPRRVSEIEYMLTRFEGRENILFRLLAQTTGPEPTDDPPKSSLRSTKITTPALREYFAKRQAPLFLRWVWNGETQDGGKTNRTVTPFHSKFDQYKSRLEAFYAHYNPIKMQEVEETLRRWRGREDILFEALIHKYGAEPTAIHGGGSKGAAMSSVNNNTSSSFAGIGGSTSSPTMLKQQQASMSDARQPLGSTPRAVLQSFYAVHNPSKLPDVDRLIERFAGRESSLFGLLESKYGVSLDGKNNKGRGNSPPQQGGGVVGQRPGSPNSSRNQNNYNNNGPSLDDTFNTPHRERVIRRPPGMFGAASPSGIAISPSNSRSPSRGASSYHRDPNNNYYNNNNNANGSGLDSDEEQTGFSVPTANISSIAGQRVANARAGSNSPTSSYTNFSFNPNAGGGGGAKPHSSDTGFRSLSFADRADL